jgi:hypothetical protein
MVTFVLSLSEHFCRKKKMRINGFLICNQVTAQMNKAFGGNYIKGSIKIFDFQFFKREDQGSCKKFSLGGDTVQLRRAFFGLVAFFVAGMFSNKAPVRKKKYFVFDSFRFHSLVF